jgi:hypothetical protein
MEANRIGDVMRAFIIPAALAIGVAAVAAAPASALVPAGTTIATSAATASGVTPAQYYYHRRHHRGGWVPYRLRGFQDPGYAYHGNINGCAVDLGYGRWESCNVGR